MSAAVRVFIILLLAYFLSYFFRTTNAVISPDLRRDLGLGSAELGLMTSLLPHFCCGPVTPGGLA